MYIQQSKITPSRSLYPSLVENFWAQINTRRGSSPNSSASEQSAASSADESSSDYDSAKDEDFKAPSESPSSDEDDSYSADWKTVRSIEGMDKTVDGHVRVYIRWWVNCLFATSSGCEFSRSKRIWGRQWWSLDEFCLKVLSHPFLHRKQVTNLERREKKVHNISLTLLIQSRLCPQVWWAKDYSPFVSRQAKMRATGKHRPICVSTKTKSLGGSAWVNVKKISQ